MLAGKDVKEIPVWGIDCYTRTMIELAIKERAAPDSLSRSTTKHFIERVLLPSVNAQEPNRAHDMKVALVDIQVNISPETFTFMASSLTRFSLFLITDSAPR